MTGGFPDGDGGRIRDCSSYGSVHGEHELTDYSAFARFTSDEREDFFRARKNIGFTAGTGAHEGAKLYAAGIEHASKERSKAFQAARPIRATPLRWIDPHKIPPREWVYAKHFARGFISATIAPGGVGKSSLTIAEALAISTGRALLGIQPDQQTNVWLWNGEDPMEELQRRIIAAAKHYRLAQSDLDDRLYVDSGRDMRITIAEQRGTGAVTVRSVIEQVIRTIRERAIGVLVVDPFIASHRVAENDNNSVEAVVAAWAEIADETGASIELVHHSRKTSSSETKVDDARGASALLAKARSVRVLNGMTAAEAAKVGADNPRLFFRCENGKANMMVPADKATWYRLESIDLGNGSEAVSGDSVGVVAPWTLPDALESISADHLRAVQCAVDGGHWRRDQQSADWVGNAVADVLGFDVAVRAHKMRITSLLKAWISDGSLVVVDERDPRGNRRPFVKVGKRAAV